MASPIFRVASVLSGKRVTFLPTPVAACAGDVATSIEQLCDGLSMLSGPWLWDGFPVAALRQPNEMHPMIWGGAS